MPRINQEAYDNMVMAYNIAEHPDVMLPIMICQDGFITSHAVMNMQLLDDLTVKEFVGERQPVDYLLNPDETFAVGPYAVSDYYMESRKAQAHAMENAKKVILDVAKKFEKISGRKYGLIGKNTRCNDADKRGYTGSAAELTKDAIDRCTANGL